MQQTNPRVLSYSQDRVLRRHSVLPAAALSMGLIADLFLMLTLVAPVRRLLQGLMSPVGFARLVVLGSMLLGIVGMGLAALALLRRERGWRIIAAAASIVLYWSAFIAACLYGGLNF